MTEILTVQDIAQILKRSPSAIRNLALRRQIPFRKLAGRLVFLKEEIEEWIAASPGKTFDQVRGVSRDKRF